MSSFGLFVSIMGLVALCKFLTPWLPISVALAAAYWTGERCRHHTSPLIRMGLVVGWVICYVCIDLAYQSFFWSSLTYAGMTLNHLALFSVCVLATFLPSYRQQWIWGPMGVSVGVLIFFLISNLGVYLAPGSLYPNTWQGLASCYVAGIPFIKSQWISNILGGVLLIGCEQIWLLSAIKLKKVI